MYQPRNGCLVLEFSVKSEIWPINTKYNFFSFNRAYSDSHLEPRVFGGR